MKLIKQKNVKLQSFSVFRVIVPGVFLYLIMNLFFSLFFYVNEYVKNIVGSVPSIVSDIPASLKDIQGATHKDLQIIIESLGSIRIRFADLSVFWFIVAMVIVYIWHLPLVRVFRCKKKNIQATERDNYLSRKRIFKSPVVASFIPTALIFLNGLIEAVLNIYLSGFSAAILESFITNSVLVGLCALFIYEYQHHLVQTKYLLELFTKEELASEIPKTQKSTIHTTILITTLISTILPVLLVIMFLSSSITFVENANKLTQPELELLFKGLINNISSSSLTEFRSHVLASYPIPYITSMDTIRLCFGLGIGLTIILIYVYLLAKWTSTDIIIPLKRMTNAMRNVELGDFTQILPIMNNDELGNLAYGFNHMVHGLSERERIKGILGQYINPEISKAILKNEIKLEGARYESSVMFTDIRGFTYMAASMQPEAVFKFLNEYLSFMIPEINNSFGMIDKFLGDGILSVFGLPLITNDHADKALHCALQMEKALERLNKVRNERGEESLSMGTSIHSGLVIAGNVGNEKKLQYTIIGDTVNVASRIEGYNKVLGSKILISETTFSLLSSELKESYKDSIVSSVELRGKSESINLYKIL